jgi:RNA ligase (TIGR02306 family)
MTRKLASIQKILSIKPIEGADRIELCQVLGWQCVIPKGEFKVGDLIVFIEIDSILPEFPEVEFLRQDKFRIRTKKFKGQISQGLVMSLDILKGKKFPEDTRENPIYDWTEGQEVTSLLEIKKYEPYIPPNMAGEIKGNFPGIMPKSDETRVQILRHLLDKYKGTKCYVSEKLDGSSVTFYINQGEFGVCSRNLELKETEGNSIWKFARAKDIENKLRALNKNISIQGEFMGPGMNKNSLKITYHDVYFFNAFDIDKQEFFELNDFKKLIENTMQLKTVPIINYDYILGDSIDELVKFSIGKSIINHEADREGIVIRSVKEIKDPELVSDIIHGRVSFKVVNPEYLLKNE